MGVHWRKDSIQELKKRKTNEELTEENKQLKKRVTELEGQLDDTMLALCDVYEQIVDSATAPSRGVAEFNSASGIEGGAE